MITLGFAVMLISLLHDVTDKKERRFTKISWSCVYIPYSWLLGI